MVLYDLMLTSKEKNDKCFTIFISLFLIWDFMHKLSKITHFEENEMQSSSMTIRRLM